MTETVVKKDDNTLTVTKVTSESHTVEEDRAEIQTQLDHLELDAAKSALDYKTKIDALKAKIAILDK